MNYLENIKDLDDLRVANKEAFRMESVYKFNLDNYISEYDYDLCEQNSDDEQSSDEEESKGDLNTIMRNDENQDSNLLQNDAHRKHQSTKGK